MMGSVKALRRDLESIAGSDRDNRFRIIACDISGTFTRVTTDAWNRLRGTKSGEDLEPSLWALASHAGWTQQRGPVAKRRRSLLAIQVPLLRIDWIARGLANCTGWVFAPMAILFWLGVFVISMVVLGTRVSWLMADLAHLPVFLTKCNPILLLTVLAATKMLHELGHAIVCRRFGAKCGDLGVMLFCGVPCPYCDVTQIWREPSSIARMAVMFAGIYVEWILTSIAVAVWCLSDDMTVRLYAVNVMVLCGVSTLVFNANPLMRYDGYYVLADWLASPDLRAEARSAFVSGLQSVVREPARTLTRFRPDRSFGLSIYHAASVVYRIVVLIAIASFLIQVCDWLGFRMASRLMVAVAAMAMVAGSRRLWFGLVSGQGSWVRVAKVRRWMFAGLILLCLIGVFCVPLPRYHRASGMMDVADATSVYLPRDSRLVHVRVDYGDQVTEGQLLAIAESTRLEQNAIRQRTRFRIASMQTVLARHRTVDGRGDDRDWMTYETAERTAKEASDEASRQADAQNVLARQAGVVVPPQPEKRRRTGANPTSVDLSLVRSEGRALSEGTVWCRIADPTQFVAVLRMESSWRGNVRHGDVIRVAMATQPGRVYEAVVETIAESDVSATNAWESGTFEVRCRVKDPGGMALLANVGTHCTAVIGLPRRSLAQRATDALAWWIYE